ncbi:uncharacterized protein LOC110435360 [Sorghum bicolor]|uniref:Uncharacterized protein n=1 Tax=Sorghum bicolor TaxID=4558 RepID=A0A1B6PTQ2_SORBI|nr:uncharacterized protein LOC110435360 [Sorghum bicolor]KXG29037.1 hypothetical protein SORBI_3005G202800 [Sorghum bicolor]|eukprot:XP_021316504.1 uncharacterized protein LOC110435360 [Sorghum bicolor]
MPERQWASIHRSLAERRNLNKHIHAWERMLQQDHFEWTKDLLRTGMTALFDDDKEKQTEVNQSQQSKDRGTTDKRKVPTKMATPLVDTQFCGMEYEELADEQLMRKDMKADRALKKKLRKEDGKEDKEDERNEEQQED